jgi:hypothetical protein
MNFIHFVLVSLYVASGWSMQPELYPQESAKQHNAMHDLFKAIDSDSNGQIQPEEALRYFNKRWKVSKSDMGSAAGASKAFMDEVDGQDEGQTVSEAEMQQALSRRLKACTHLS